MLYLQNAAGQAVEVGAQGFTLNFKKKMYKRNKEKKKSERYIS